MRAAGVEPAYQPKKEWASRLGLYSTVELCSHNPYPQPWSVEGIRLFFCLIRVARINHYLFVNF